MCEATTQPVKMPPDMRALRVFVRAAERMTENERHAAVNYLSDRYGDGPETSSAEDVVNAVRDHFSRLLEKSDMASWNQRAAIRLLEIAFTKALVGR